MGEEQHEQESKPIHKISAKGWKQVSQARGNHEDTSPPGLMAILERALVNHSPGNEAQIILL